MVVSLYQVNNVLRVYKNQLRHNKIASGSSENQTSSPDRISISVDAKRKSMVAKVASDIVDRITQYGPQDNFEKEVLKKLENEYGAHLDVSPKDSKDLLFKIIDENGETMNSLSIEDSNFLAHKLQEIAMKTVDKTENNKIGDYINEN